MAVNYTSPIEMIHFDSTGIHTVNYQVINQDGLDWACSIFKVINTSDSKIFISYDGITDHDYVQENGRINLNIQTNSIMPSDVSRAKKGFKVYIRGTLPKFGGWIYLIGYS